MSGQIDILEAALRELDAGRGVALAAVVATRGSTPQPPGALLCVDDAAGIVGTLGGGCLEDDARRRARELLARGGGAVLSFDLDHEDGDGMICGGHMDVLVEALRPGEDRDALAAAVQRLRGGADAELSVRGELGGRPVEFRLRLEAPPNLVIAGGGHVGRLVAELAQRLGFLVSVIDDRVRYANPRRFPPPARPVVGPIAETLRRWPIDARTYIVIVTRGHAHDEGALEAVLASPARYVGMIGSRRKVEAIFAALRDRGATDEQLARVAAPIGLDINAVTTEEIALSIVAQLTRVRRAVRVPLVEGPLPIREPAA